MTAFVALLRGINLGKRQLRMAELRQIAVELGLAGPKTYIASGNLMFTSDRNETALKAQLERRIAEHMGSPVGVMIRTAEELAEVSSQSVCRRAGIVVAIFLDDAAPYAVEHEARRGN